MNYGMIMLIEEMVEMQNCYMDTNIVHVKTNDIYNNIAEDVGTEFNNLNFQIDKPLPKGKNIKCHLTKKDELGGKIMKEFVKLTILKWKNLCFNELVQNFIEIQGWLLLMFSICLHNQLSYFNSIIVQMSEKRDSSYRQ